MHEQAARPEQFEAEQVDVLVAARGFFGERGGGGELGRIEDDQVELAALVAQRAQRLEHVGLLPFGARCIQAVVGQISAAMRNASPDASIDSTDFAPPRSAYSEKPPV